MPDPTGRWVNKTQWQCPKCGWVNGVADERCQSCAESVRPPADEPIRPPDPLDVVGKDRVRAGDATGPVEIARKAVQIVTRVTRAKAVALFGDSLRSGLTERGEHGDRAWQAITEMPDNGQGAAMGAVVDDLEEAGFALYRIGDDQPAGREGDKQP